MFLTVTLLAPKMAQKPLNAIIVRKLIESLMKVLLSVTILLMQKARAQPVPKMVIPLTRIALVANTSKARK